MGSIVLSLVLLTSGLENIQGQLNFTCPVEWKKMFCANDYNNVTSCTYITSDFIIISADVDKRMSDASCDYYEDDPETYTGSIGVFGYYDNYIWTYKGCRARFNFCAVLQSTGTPQEEFPTTKISMTSSTGSVLESTKTPLEEFPTNELSITSSTKPTQEILDALFIHSTTKYTLISSSSTYMSSITLPFSRANITNSTPKDESPNKETNLKLLAGATIGGIGALAAGGALSSVIMSRTICNKISPSNNNGDLV